MGGGRRKQSAEDQALDRLAIEATSKRSLQSDKQSRYDADVSERMWHRRWLWQFGAVVGVLAIILGGIIWYVVRGHLERAAAEERGLTLTAEYEARIAVVGEETKAEVEKLLSQSKFEGAKLALQKGNAKELPNDVWVDLDAKITTAVRAHRNELLDKLEAEIEKNSLTTAEKLLDEVRALDGFGHPGSRRFDLEHDLQDKIGQAEAEERKRAESQELARRKDILVQSREAVQREEWDEARRLLEVVRQKGGLDLECDLWEKELRRLIGGRLTVESNVANAKVLIPGKDAVRVGEVVVGLPPGETDFVVDAEGYVPESRTTHVRYPEVIKELVELVPEAPGPLWATRALSGHCAQRLIADYYLRSSESKEAPWRGAVDQMAQPCCKKRKVKRSKKELADMVDREIEKFLSRLKDDPILALNGLGKFAAKYPKVVKRILGNKECSRAIRKIIDDIEHGCADCAGQGQRFCAACEGKGKRKELRTCDACNGSGWKTCPKCHGTGSIKCPKCKGKGTILVKRRGPGMLDKRSSKTCPACHGEGKVKCTRCEGGKLHCTKCKGTGRGDFMGPCSECGGTGRVPCSTCDTTGNRESMNIDRRREVERDLSKMIGGKP